MAAVGITAVALEQKGAFDLLRRSDDFAVKWADHDEPWEDSVERMQHIRQIIENEIFSA